MKKIVIQVSSISLAVAQIPSFILVTAFLMQKISLISYRFFAPAFTLFFILLTKANWIIIPVALITSLLTLRSSNRPRLKILATVLLIIPFILTIILTFF